MKAADRHRLGPWFDASEHRLLVSLLVGEAADEPYIGQRAICHVVMNRVMLSRWAWIRWWPTTVHENVLAPYQFTCFWGAFHQRRRDMEQALADPNDFPISVRAAGDVLAGFPDVTDGADSYFNPKLANPSWAKSMTRTVRIGDHDFYSSALRP